MPSNLDQNILAKLQPHAQQLATARMELFSKSWMKCPARRRQRTKTEERELVQSLWSEAYRQGLTKFAMPPIFVSLFCRALWSVVWYLAQQILNRKAD